MAAKDHGPQSTLELQPQQKPSLSQRLIMTDHMQQAIHLLQLPVMELEPFIEEQITQNPLLELDQSEELDQKETETEIEQESSEDLPVEQEITIDDRDLSVLKLLEEIREDWMEQEFQPRVKRTAEEDKQKSFLESLIRGEVNLYHFLMQEAHETFDDPKELKAAETLIGYIDEAGFLETPLIEISILHNIHEEKLQAVLQRLQTFEPYGIGASSIQESLLIQLRCLKKEHSLAYQIVQNCYEDLLHNRIPVIQKNLGCPLEEIKRAIKEDIAKLDLHPGFQFSIQKNQPLVPDVSLRQEGDHLYVDVNRDSIPHLKLNHTYLKLLENPDTPLQTKAFIRKHIFSARWLMRNLQHRYSTIERIASALAQKQYEFFTHPEGKLIPLTMKALAEELNLHESTIARTVSNKYINTPRGLLPLRAFFTTEYISDSGESLSARTVQEAIVAIIEAEDKQAPLSDEKISALLKQKGILCARRTVAKYRTLLNIGGALQRRKF